MKNDRIEEMYRLYSVPKHYWSVTFQGVNPKSKKELEKYFEHFKKNIAAGIGLYLWGDLGSGKTAAACLVLKLLALSKSIETALFLSHTKLQRYSIEKTIHSRQITIVEYAEKCKILVLDDLEISKHDSYSVKLLEQLVKDRYHAQLPTILTGNFPPGYFSEHLPATASVMKETMIPIKFEGDKRKRITEEKLGDFE